MDKVYYLKLCMKVHGHTFQDAAIFDNKEDAIKAFNSRLKTLESLFPDLQRYTKDSSRLYNVKFYDDPRYPLLQYYITEEDKED